MGATMNTTTEHPVARPQQPSTGQLVVKIPLAGLLLGVGYALLMSIIFFAVISMNLVAQPDPIETGIAAGIGHEAFGLTLLMAAIYLGLGIVLGPGFGILVLLIHLVLRRTRLSPAVQNTIQFVVPVLLFIPISVLIIPAEPWYGAFGTYFFLYGLITVAIASAIGVWYINKQYVPTRGPGQEATERIGKLAVRVPAAGAITGLILAAVVGVFLIGTAFLQARFWPDPSGPTVENAVMGALAMTVLLLALGLVVGLVFATTALIEHAVLDRTQLRRGYQTLIIFLAQVLLVVIFMMPWASDSLGYWVQDLLSVQYLFILAAVLICTAVCVRVIRRYQAGADGSDQRR